MSPQRPADNRQALAFVAVVAVVIGAMALVMFTVNQGKPESSTSSSSCGLAVFPNTPDYPPACGAPLSYTAFQQYVAKSLSVEHQNGGIILYVGYHPCTIWFYVLPNATDVMVYLGTVNASDFCA